MATPSLAPGCARYLSLTFWPSRQARNAAAASSRSSALLNLRRIFGGWPPSGVFPLISSTPCFCMRLRLLIRVQLTRPVITHPFKNVGRFAVSPSYLLLLSAENEH